MIKVTVQREDRLRAIMDLASAIKSLADALCTSPSVLIHDCTINGSDGIGLNIDTADKVTRTEIIDNSNQNEE